VSQRPDSPASAELKARILAAMQASPSPPRQTTREATRLLVPAAAVFAAGLYFAFDGVHHGEGRPLGFLAATVSVWIGAALVSLWSVVGTARSPTGRPRPWLLAVTVGMPVVVLTFLVGLSAAAGAADAARVAAIHRAGVRCLAMTLAAGIVPLLALLFLKRGSDPVHPAAQGAAIGVSFGAYAGIMVCLWCPDLSPAHAAIGHVTPLALLALVGALVGGRVLDLPKEASPLRS
jgi:hypothetical protein